MLRTFERLPAFPPHRIRDMKEECFVRRFFGIRPLYVSVVVPTLMKEDRQEFRQAILNKTIYEVSHLIDRGIVDELLIVDGSSSNGEVDFSPIDEILRACYARISLFRDEVDMMREHPGIEQNVMRGYRDICVKAVHQRDPEIQKLLRQFDVAEEVPRGKGAALWVSVPLTKGDVIAYVDSDIKNFLSDFILSLIGPILQDWNHIENDSKTKYVKAYYSRLGINIDEPDSGQYVLGGRACRLFAKPIFSVLADQGYFGGLENLQYPLSGEFAGTRKFFEDVNFVNGYGIEVAMLCQAIQYYGVECLAQVNFEIFQHLSQKEDSIQNMVGEIADTILHYHDKHYDEPIDSGLVEDYLDRAWTAMEEYKSMTSNAGEIEGGYTYYYDEEMEAARIQSYADILHETIQSRNSVDSLPRWQSQDVDLGRLRYEMRRQAILSTYDAINRAELGQ